MSVLRPSRRSRSPVFAILTPVLLSGGIAVAGIGLAAVAETAPTAHAQVATLGSPPPEAEASPAPAGVLGEQDAMLAWAECMRDNGVEVTDPVFDAAGNLVGGLQFEGAKDAGPKDAKSEGFQAASEACSDLLVAFKPAVDPALEAEQTEAALRFAVCMREQGLDWPDPAPDGTKFAGSEVKIDKESAQFQAAYEVCDEALALEDEGEASE